MRVEVQYTAGCQGARPVLERVKELAHSRDDLTLTLTQVQSGGVAPAGFVGSPTVLVDGINPFGGAVVDAAACSLQPPTPDQVEAALDRPSPV